MANRARSHLVREQEIAPLCVVLHGALRTRLSMLWMERALKKAGFEVLNRSYQWRNQTLAEISAELHEKLRPFEEREKYFVTHSFGGLVVRDYLHRFQPKLVRRLVMLAPPNRGSCIARYNQSHAVLGPTFRKIYGHAAEQLIPKAVEKLASPSCEFAVIAGGRGKKNGYIKFLPGDNDGIVLVEETKLRGMADFALVPHLHSFIMNGRDTVSMTIRFLTIGRLQ